MAHTDKGHLSVLAKEREKKREGGDVRKTKTQTVLVIRPQSKLSGKSKHSCMAAEETEMGFQPMQQIYCSH